MSSPRTPRSACRRLRRGLLAVAGVCLLGATPGALIAAEGEGAAAIARLEAEIQQKGLAVGADDYRALGEAYLSQQRFAEAAGAFARAIELGRDELALRQRTARLWEAAGRPEQAAMVALGLAADAPQGVDAAAQALHAAQLIERRVGDIDRALAEYRAVAETWPGSPQARAALRAGYQSARHHRRDEQRDRIAVLALRQFPDDAELMRRVAFDHLDELADREGELARRAVDAIRAADPGIDRWSGYVIQRAQVYARSGDPAKGVALLLERADQGRAWARFEAGKLAKDRLRDPQRAAAIWQRYLSEHPLHWKAGEALRELERMEVDLAPLAEQIALRATHERLQHHWKDVVHPLHRDFHQARRGEAEARTLLAAHRAIEEPLAVWPGDLLDSRCQAAGRLAERDDYFATLRVLAAVDPEEAVHAVQGQHHTPEDWDVAIVESVRAHLDNDWYRAEMEAWLLRERFAGSYRDFAAAAGTFLADHGSHERWAQVVLVAQLERAAREKAAESAALLARVLDRIEAEGLQDDRRRFAEAAFAALTVQLDAMEPSAGDEALRRVARLGHGEDAAAWAAARLVRRLRERGAMVDAAIAFHAAVARADSRDREQFDALLALAEEDLAAGRVGLAAGAFNALADRFDRIDAERRGAARRAATQAWARLGGSVAAEVLAIDDDDPLAPVLRAQVQLAAGDQAEAWRLVRDHLEPMGQHLERVPGELVLLVARNLSRQGDHERAADLLKRFLRVAESHDARLGAQVGLALGGVRYRAEDYPTALLDFRSVIASHGDSREALQAQLRIGDCFNAMRQHDEARQVYQRYAEHELEEIRVEATFRLALLEQEQGNAELALGLFKRLAEMNLPEDLVSRLYLDWGAALISENRLREAEDVILMVGIQQARDPVSPGETLRVTLRDPFLQASQNRAAVPVVVTTASGDEERVELALSPDVKGLYTGQVITALGATVPGDGTLQIRGGDSIRYDYAPDFVSASELVTIGSGEIPIASEGELKAAGTPRQVRFAGEAERGEDGLEALGLSFDSEELERQRRIASSLSRRFRGPQHIKPGGTIHLAVRDGDRDRAAGPDAVPVVLRSQSGDQVQVELAETGDHSGIFRARVATAAMPAGVLVSDSAPGRTVAAMLAQPDAPDHDEASAAWIARGDREPGKTVTLDFKRPATVDRFLWSRGYTLPAAERGRLPEHRPGLRGSYFRGRGLSGVPVAEVLEVPGHKSAAPHGLGRDDWSARWQGELQVPAAGRYRFRVRADDGVRVRIGGRALFAGEEWKDSGPQDLDAELELPAGWVPIEVEYYQAGGGNELSLAWLAAGAEGAPRPLRQAELRARPAVDRGPTPERIPTRYRIETSSDGRWWTPLATQAGGVVPRGRFDLVTVGTTRLPRQARDAQRLLAEVGTEAWRASAGAGPVGPVIEDPAEVEGQPALSTAAGELLVPEAGRYEFALRAGGRAWLRVGDSLVVDKDRDQAADDGPVPAWRGALDLPAGLVPIALLRASELGHGGASLLWRRPEAETFEPVPAVALDPQAGADAVAAFSGFAPAALLPLDDRYGAELRFASREIRFLRMVIDEWSAGDAPALARVAAWSGDQALIPQPGVDYAALGANDTLELSAGDEVEVAYFDAETKSGNPQQRRVRLQATFFDGALSFLDARSVVGSGGRLEELLFDRFRFQVGERLTLRVVDYDADTSDRPDTLPVRFRSAAGEVVVDAVETGDASGVFQAEIRTAERGGDATTLVVADGEQVTASYTDRENTVPGYPVERSAAIRETVASAGTVAILPSSRGADGSLAYGEAAVADAAVALAPLRIEVVDPDVLVSAGSRIALRLETSSGARLDVVVDAGQDRERFACAIPLVLDRADRDPWRLPGPGDDRAHNASVMGGRAPAGADPVLPVRGGDTITVSYLEGLGHDATPAERVQFSDRSQPPAASARLLTAGRLAVLHDDYETPLERAWVAGRLYLRVEDADADRSDERDAIAVEIATGLGDRLALELMETENHSGVFTASIAADHAAAADPANAALETTFGDELTLAYRETGREDPARIALPVAEGHDGEPLAFAKRYGDEAFAAATQVRLAECNFELYKQHRTERKALEREGAPAAELERLDALIAETLAEGTTLLRRAIHDYPDSAQMDEVLYLLGNFEQEGGRLVEAISRYRTLLSAFPDSPRAAEAQYKLAQTYEEQERHDQAWEAYVRLAYRWGDHELVGDAMARIGDYYEQRGKALLAEAQRAARGETVEVPAAAREDLDQAARVYGKLVERFPAHPHAEAIALKRANCWWLIGDYAAARRGFDAFAETFADSAYRPKALYWAGRATLEGGDAKAAALRFLQLIQSYPESDEAKRARGLMLQDQRLAGIDLLGGE